MPERTPRRHTVALQGFSEIERGALAAFFHLAAGHATPYEQVATLMEADFILADAQNTSALAAVAQTGRTTDTLFIGPRAPQGASAWLTRAEPASILRELDRLLAQRHAGSSTAENEPSDDPSAEAPPAAKEVLVVDDSRIALKFLQVRLQGLGYRVHVAQNSDIAMDLLSSQAFDMVFLDVVLGPEENSDGFALCQHIKQRGRHPGGVVPQVVMVTGLAGGSDRVRGALAGCDAYLSKPLVESEFLDVLQALDPTDSSPDAVDQAAHCCE